MPTTPVIEPPCASLARPEKFIRRGTEVDDAELWWVTACMQVIAMPTKTERRCFASAMVTSTRFETYSRQQSGSTPRFQNGRYPTPTVTDLPAATLNECTVPMLATPLYGKKSGSATGLSTVVEKLQGSGPLSVANNRPK